MKAAGATSKDQALVDWIDVIVGKCLPLSCVEDQKCADALISARTLKATLFKLEKINHTENQQ